MDSFCAEMQRPALRLRCVTEPEPVGTGGGLRLVADLLDAQFLLLNGDTLFDINLNDLVTPPLPADGSVLARMALRWVPDTTRYGAITLDSGRVTPMHEKGRTGEGL
jgi:D-glycero-D-manno-heptose 1,7-bisphosphate phosphatase